MRRLFLFALLLCSTLVHAEPTELDWLELMPKEDQLALEAMPEISHDSPEAAGSFGQQAGLKQELGLPAVMYFDEDGGAPGWQAHWSRAALHRAPLESDAEGRTTLLFLVPYPGACIHVPPPPPNQMVLVRYPKGIALDDIYEPLWVDGTLHIETVNNDLADAAYALDARSVRLVEEGDL